MSQQPFNSDGGFSTTGNITGTNIVTSTETTLENIGSLMFSGSNWLSFSPGVTIGSGAYTVECFVYFQAANLPGPILGSLTPDNSGFSLVISSATQIHIDQDGVAANNYTVAPMADDTWHHIAVTRNSSGDETVFVDGVRSSDGITTTNYDFSGASTSVGKFNTGGQWWYTGGATQIRAVAGYNVYDPNASTITVPTTSLTAVTGTELLLDVESAGTYLIDSSNTQTVTDNGAVTFSASGPAVTYSTTTGGTITANNISLNSGYINGGTAIVINDGINSIALAPGAQMDVFGFPFSQPTRGQLTITGDISTTQALGTWYYESVNTVTYRLYTDATYTDLVDASGWTPYTGGGLVAITKQSPVANIVINSNGYLSTFTDNGQVILPGGIDLGVGGNLVLSSGNITGSGASPAPSLNGFHSVGAIDLSAIGNITGGNVRALNNVYVEATNGNLVLGDATATASPGLNSTTSITFVADSDGTPKEMVLSTDGTLYTPGNISTTGNIAGSNLLGNGATLSNVATQSKGSWTVTTGSGTYSFTVPANATYALWVDGNIPNGIIVWNATVSLSNTNVPAIGQQFAWYYLTGNNLVWTSIPNQIIGTAGSISNAAPAVANTNVFTFGITNNSGSSQTINYGWTKIS